MVFDMVIPTNSFSHLKFSSRIRFITQKEMDKLLIQERRIYSVAMQNDPSWLAADDDQFLSHQKTWTGQTDVCIAGGPNNTEEAAMGHLIPGKNSRSQEQLDAIEHKIKDFCIKATTRPVSSMFVGGNMPRYTTYQVFLKLYTAIINHTSRIPSYFIGGRGYWSVLYLGKKNHDPGCQDTYFVANQDLNIPNEKALFNTFEHVFISPGDQAFIGLYQPKETPVNVEKVNHNLLHEAQNPSRLTWILYKKARREYPYREPQLQQAV